MNHVPQSVALLQSHAYPMDDIVYRALGDTKTQTHCPAVAIYSAALCEERDITEWLTSHHVQHMLVKGILHDTMPPLIARFHAPHSMSSITDALLRGCALLYITAEDVFYAWTLRAQNKRLPSDSSMEVSIRGPRDGLIEDVYTNIALIRRRLPQAQLKCKMYTLGTMTKTKAALLYVQDTVQPIALRTVMNKLDTIRAPHIITAQHVEHALETKSLFPKFHYTGRPDLVAESLLAGQFALLIDNNPSVSLAPTTLMQFVRAPEDAHFARFDSIGHVLRWFGFVLSAVLPGFWISLVAYHQEQLPFSLLATVTISRSGLPFSSISEMYVLLLLFELLREAGMRLPQHIGQTLTVVGGIIIGDAAIRSGLASPSLVVIAAATAVGTFTLANQDVMAACSWLRWGMLVMASAFGFFGLFVALFVAIIHISAQTSFGVPMASARKKVPV
jgi:hypothetical protein